MARDRNRLLSRKINLDLFPVLVLICWGIIVYSNTFASPFQFDDNFSILNNPAIRNPADFVSLWQFWPNRFITFFSLSLNYYFHSLDVFGYHLINLLIHLAAAILVWRLVILTFSTPVMKTNALYLQRSLIGLLAALLFLSHPVQTEAVTYLHQRSTSLTGFFYLACLCLYVKSRLERLNILYVLAWVVCLVAFFTKENSVTLPLMLVVYEACFLTQDRHSGLKYTLPFMIILPIILIIVFFYRPLITFVDMDKLMTHPVTGMNYFFTQLRVMLTYLRLAVAPVNQNIDYDYPVYQSLFDWPVLASLFILVVIFIAAARLFSRQRIAAFSIAWFFLALVPESSFFPLNDIIFEHRLYLPLVGYSIILVYAVFYFFRRRAVYLPAAVLLIIITGYAILAHNRNFVWRDELSLWADAVTKSPNKARPYSHRGFAYSNRGDYAAAILDCSRAIELNPNYTAAYYNRGNTYFNRSIDSRSAITCRYKDKFDSIFVSIYDQRVPFCFNEDDLKQALSDYSKTLGIDTKYASAYINRGITYFISGDLPRAISDYNRALGITPGNSDIYINRGLAYAAMGNFPQAIADYTQAIKLFPAGAATYYERAIADYLAGEYNQSRQDLKIAEGLGYAPQEGFRQKLNAAKN